MGGVLPGQLRQVEARRHGRGEHRIGSHFGCPKPPKSVRSVLAVDTVGQRGRAGPVPLSMVESQTRVSVDRQ